MWLKARTIAIAGEAWRVAWDMAWTQPRLVRSVFVAYVILYAPYYLVWLDIGPSAAIRPLLEVYGSWIFQLALGISCLPLTYAACRRVLVADDADHPLWRSPAWRNRAFLIVATGLFLLKTAISKVSAALSDGSFHRFIQSDDLAFIGSMLLWFVGLYLGLKLWLLAPAAATQAKGLGIRNAMLDSNGQFWRLWFTWLLATTPLWIPSYVLSYLSDHHVGPTDLAENISGLWTELIGFALIMVGPAVMAIYYDAIGRQLKGS